jgi:MerR family copper efflux transcriptional regulator
MKMISIGRVADLLNVTSYTLRYYEKIGLIAPVSKTTGVTRQYRERDIERVKFIKRAQRMHFSLDEIRALINLHQADIKKTPKHNSWCRTNLSKLKKA